MPYSSKIAEKTRKLFCRILTCHQEPGGRPTRHPHVGHRLIGVRPEKPHKGIAGRARNPPTHTAVFPAGAAGPRGSAQSPGAAAENRRHLLSSEPFRQLSRCVAGRARIGETTIVERPGRCVDPSGRVGSVPDQTNRRLPQTVGVIGRSNRQPDQPVRAGIDLQCGCEHRPLLH